MTQRCVLCVAIMAWVVVVARVACAQESKPQAPDTAAATANPSPWLLVPLVSSSPKLGTSGGALAAYLTKFDPDSRVSLFGALYQYTSTHSSIGSLFARTSFGADHHRIVAIAALGLIKNDYQDYLGTGQPLKTDDDLKAVAARYLYRIRGDWLVGVQGNAANYQVLGATPEDDLVLETLGVRGFSSTALGAAVMHDSRDNEDMPSHGWYMNLNNLAYREALGGAESFDAYRADFKAFLPHGRRHVLAIRQYNWLTDNAPAAGQATILLRGYKLGQYLAQHMSSLEVEERVSLGRRWGATLFVGAAGLYGTATIPLDRQIYPTWGGGLHFVIKPAQRMVANLEYAQGVHFFPTRRSSDLDRKSVV